MPATMMLEDDQVEVTSLNTLANKTVFLRVSFGRIGNSKKVKEDVLDTTADETMLKVTRMLLDSEELTAIGSVVGQINSYLNNTCNLSKSLGVRIVPNNKIPKVVARLKEFRLDWDMAVNDFVQAYPSLIEKAAKRLGPVFHAEDYPAPSEVASKFSFKYNIVSFGVPGQLQAISPELFEEQLQEQKQMMVDAAEEYKQNRRKLLLDLVAKLKDKLTPGEDGKLKQFRKNTVENIKEFLAENVENDVIGDDELTSIVQQAKDVINPVNADMLRDNDTFRETVKSQLDVLSDSLSGLVEEKSGRKFREE